MTLSRRLRAAADVAGAAVLLAGLPWGLSRLAGYPLSGHWPGEQLREPGASPLGGGTAVIALAGAAWLLWAVFAVAVIAEVTAAACGRPVPRLPAIAPVQAAAATLAGAIVFTALPRTAARATPAGHTTMTATATAAGPALPGIAGRVASSAGDRPWLSWPDSATWSCGLARTAVRVRTVEAGDSLWDLARTYLGSGYRWREIYDLNRGRPQPGGGTLTDPSRIYPGWELLIPAASPHPPPAGGANPSRPARSSGTPPLSSSPSPARSPHPPPATPGTPPPAGPPGVRLPSGALIGLGTALAVSTALALARLHRRRRYRPGTILTSSLEPATAPPPVISALDRATRTPAPPADETGPDGAGPGLDLDLDLDLDEPPAAPARPAPGQPGMPAGPGGLVPVGIRGGQEITASPAALGGLGLTGPGAPAAARAILAGLLTRSGGRAAQVIIPAADAAQFLPGPARDQADAPLSGLLLVPDLEVALDEAEALILRHARTADNDDGDQDGRQGAAVILAGAPGPAAAQRLAGITRAGRDHAVMVILLGAWPHGTTCHITASGLISNVTPPHPVLAGTEAYHLQAADLAAILAQLDQARDIPAGRPPAPSPPEPAHTHLRKAASPRPGPEVPPARAAQQSAENAGPGTGSGPAGALVRISVLGPLRITADGREIGSGLRKARELLAFLVICGPDGATGEAISEALWPGAPPGAGTRQRNIALRKARELLRSAAGRATPMWITLIAGRYRLDPALAEADLWQFQAALEAARTATGDRERLAALREAAACYRGPLADGAGYDWAEPYAETARRRALDAWARIAEILQPADPDQALAALEAALTHDPCNEYTYQQIMRLQAAAGRPDAVRRTLALLETRLGDLGLTPAASTRDLTARLLGTPPPPGQGGSPPPRPHPR